MNTASPQLPSAASRPRPYRRYLIALLGLLALIALACLGSFIAVNAAQPVADPANGHAAAAGRAPDTGTTQPAHWVKKRIRFVYQGFTTHYSCQGLTDQVRRVLLELGARKSDLNVHQVGCTTNIGEPQAIPSVGGTFSVLEPLPSSGPRTNGRHAVQATWQTVRVRVGTPGLDESGQCELVNEVKAKIVPLFTTRHVEFESNCIPYQLTTNGASLTVEVLKPAGRGGNAMAEASAGGAG